jgi:hypothetical protein
MSSNPPGRETPPFSQIDVLWITAGLGCDGDTISMTAATQPSLEDILLGGIPWIPKVNFHNPCLAYANGEDFLKPFHRAAQGDLSPFILVIEGSIPNENNKTGNGSRDKKMNKDILEESRRVLGGIWNRSENRPAHPHLRLDRSLGAQGLGRRCCRHLRHLWRNPCHGGQSHRMHGARRLLRLEMEIDGGDSHRVRARLPGSTR